MNNVEKELIIQLLKGREDLICDYLFIRSYSEVKKILKMEEWKDKKFEPLLTSNIWNSNYDEIFKILKMEEWEEEKFQPLLTSTIWCSNYENVKSKLHLPCWGNPIYEKLLTSTIFVIKEEYILGNIELFEEFGIENFITVNSLRKNPEDQRILIEYLIDNKIDLVINMKLNPIINATKKVLKEKYNIDMNELKKGRKK